MSTAARPRPRPKPRPRAPSAVPSSPGPSGSLTSPPPRSTPVVINVDDEDDAFFNKRSTVDWSRKPKSPEKVKRKPSKARDSDSEGDSDSVVVKPRPKKKAVGRKAAVLDWTKSSNAIISLDDDEADDILDRILADSSSSTSSKRIRRDQPDHEPSSKRQRSRSRSLTPPPQLSRQVMQNTADKIRAMIPIENRAPSPTSFADEYTSATVLDPELIRIRMNAGVDAHTPAASRGTTPAPEGGGPEKVKVTVKWRPHPLNESARPQQWNFEIKRHDSFKSLFEEAADMAAILSDNLIVTHRGTRVFPSTSPHALGVFAHADLEACDKATYDYIQTHQRRSASIEPIPTPAAHGFTASLPPTQEEDEDQSDAESATSVAEDKGDLFKIILRSKGHKDVSLTVRPTTKCGAIVKAFLKKLGLLDKYPGAGEVVGKPAPKKGRKSAANVKPGGPWLMVDGDKLGNGSEISEADLEDGDMIEVTGL
ncbi:hypothetical protein EIP91_001777 [Steccherinum ochraceum]|uniref:Rad60/SUMO-like domain-containing protein n=1 Tax=Steccherinum ochraceum TaxID=92696 RepID=A0A4R0S0X4_9APHY|nr:hypothetical protein EIP91_001777 [Steccherinum ochraceum]